MKNKNFSMLLALLVAVMVIPAFIGYAAPPTAAPPTANVDANFNSVKAGYGAAAPTLGISGKGVTGAKFENSTATNTVNLGSATAAVDATGVIKNVNLTIAANGDISTGSPTDGNPVKIVDTWGLRMESTTKGLEAVVTGVGTAGWFSTTGTTGINVNATGASSTGGKFSATGTAVEAISSGGYGVLGNGTTGVRGVSSSASGTGGYFAATGSTSTGVFGQGSATGAGGSFEGGGLGYSVKLANANGAVDATGPIKNAGLTIATNGDISDASAAVTVNDAQGMEIKGSGNLSVDLAVNGRIRTGDASGNGGVWVDSGLTRFVGSTGTTVGFWNNGDWRLNVTSAGNVGIGTTAPTSKLEVTAKQSNGDTGTFYYNGGLYYGSGLTAINNNGGNSSGTPIYSKAFLAGYGLNPSSAWDNNYGVWGHVYGTGDSGYGIVASNGATPATASKYVALAGDSYSGIFMGGNVGIGTTAPAYKLDVAGSARASDLYADNSISAISGNVTAYNGYVRANSIGKIYQKTYTWSDAEITAATTTSDGDILFRFATSSTTWVFPTPTCNGSDSALAVGGTGSWASVNPGVNKIAQFKTDLSAQKGNIFLNDPDRALRRWSTTVKCFDPMGTASDTSTAATRWTT